MKINQTQTNQPINPKKPQHIHKKKKKKFQSFLEEWRQRRKYVIPIEIGLDDQEYLS